MQNKREKKAKQTGKSKKKNRKWVERVKIEKCNIRQPNYKNNNKENRKNISE